MSKKFNEKLENEGNLIYMIRSSDLKDLAAAIVDELGVQGVQNNRPEDKDYLTAREVCVKLGISRPTLWRWAQSGYLVPIFVGKQRRYKTEDVLRIMSQGKVI